MPQIDENKIADRPQWLNTEEAAAFLGVKMGWLDRTRLKGGIGGGPTFTKLGGTVVYKKEDLLKYLEENTHRTEVG